MNLEQWLDRITHLHPRKWDLGLERVGEVGQRLDVLAPAPRVFLVAGTNGKGSACEAINHLCMAQGLSTGKSTSPHLIRFNERIEVNGEAAADAEICLAFEQIEQARGDITLSYFEFGALASLLVFKARRVDAAVLEIGLGGRLDAMNIVAPDVSVITRIALDHQDWLGNTRGLIGREKAGVMRRGKPCVVSDHDAPAELLSYADEMCTPVALIDREFGVEGERCHFRLPNGETVEYVLRASPRLPLDSLLAGMQAVILSGLLPRQGDVDGLVGLGLAGRFQQLAKPCRIILDVAHNPDAAVLLAHRIKQQRAARCRAVFGMYRDKDIEGVLAAMLPCVDEWYLCQVQESRAMPVQELATCLAGLGGSIAGTYDRVPLAFDAARKRSDSEDLVLVFGSFPVVGNVLEHLGLPVASHHGH